MNIRTQIFITVLALTTVTLCTASAQHLSIDALIAGDASQWSQVAHTLETPPVSQSTHNLTVELTASEASDPISTIQFYLACKNPDVKIEDVMPTGITRDHLHWKLAASVVKEKTTSGEPNNIVRCVIFRTDTESDIAIGSAYTLIDVDCVGSNGSPLRPEDFIFSNAYAITASGKRVTLQSGKQLQISRKMEVHPAPEHNSFSKLSAAKYDVLNLIAELPMR